MVKKTLLTIGLLLSANALQANEILQNDANRWFIGFTQASGSGTWSLSYNDTTIYDDVDISPDVTTFIVGKINKNQDRLAFVYSTSTLNSGATKNIGIGYDAVITLQSLRSQYILPYWSGGLEYLNNSDSELSGFSARVGLGFYYNINKDIELNLGYKYNIYYMSGTNDSNIETYSSFNTVGFGLNYKF